MSFWKSRVFNKETSRWKSNGMFLCYGFFDSLPLAQNDTVLDLCKSTAGGGQGLKRRAADHRAKGRKGLDAADMLPMPLRDGVQPDHLTRLALGFPQGGDGTRLVDGLGIR